MTNQQKLISILEQASGIAEEEKTPDFESMLLELEKIVKDLEGELKLEQALGLFERGLVLSQDCEKYLRAAEQRIEILKRTAAGIQTEPFEEVDALA